MIPPPSHVPVTSASSLALSPTARLLGAGGALLILLGLLTGGYVAAGMTGKLPIDPRTALSAHLNALLGAFFIFGVAWSLPMLRYSATGARRLAWAVLLANYANWFVTAVKAYLRVSGVDYTGEGANDAVFATLTALVVLPSIGAAIAWVWGFRGPSTRS